MKTYAQLYVKNLAGKVDSAMGSFSTIQLDGRMNLHNMKEAAKHWARNMDYVYIRIFKTNTLLHDGFTMAEIYR